MDGTRDTSGSMGQLSSAGSTSGASARMHHSHSTPAGVDGGARTPPATPKKGGKMLAVRVQMLDDKITMFQVQAKALGRVLFDEVCKQLSLLEADYFGLEYSDLAKTRYWLDLQKPVSRQLGLSLVDPLLHFCVKFYTPDPSQLEEEFTRYLFCLQVKRDLAQGFMQCNDNTAALMASYIVQAECGDFVQEDYPDHTYLSSYKFVPHQDQELERRIMENHKKHAGQSPAEADLNLLETARRCELYGMKMHPAKDHEGVHLNLAVAHMGLVVFQNYTKINTFSWAKIRKISFKRKRFLVKLLPEGYGYYKDTVEFFFEGRNECKNFWKKCVENHGFFRCSAVKHVARQKTRVLSRGSSFRYSGKTQKQIQDFVRANYVKRQAFQRSTSFRHSSAHASAANVHASTVGNSISAHPLLPLSDGSLSNAEVAKLSTSLVSMDRDKVGRGLDSPTTKGASRPQGTATYWSTDRTSRPATLPSRTTTSPSPPLTTLSGTPVTSTTTSPQHTYEDLPKPPYTASSPVAVCAAVHRADTGQTIITTKTGVCSHKSEGSLDKTTATTTNTPPIINTNKFPSQTHSQFDLDDTQGTAQKDADFEYTYKSVTIPKHHVWQRSASCKELYDFSFDDTGQAKRRIKPAKINIPDKSYINLEERKLESPITRYDDSNRVLYSSTTSRNVSLEIHQDIMVPDTKVYSSSYPGTTSLSQESMEDPGNYELRDSQDDLSHDSYELLERSDDEYSTSGDFKYRKARSQNTRSCSLDSGNYLPSDTDSDTEHVRYKSSTDVNQDIFLMDDPRDLPREKVPRKSDGSFYKAFKLSSRTSSLESKSDYYDSRVTKTSKESLKKPKERSLGSRTSSQESKSDYDIKKTGFTRKNKSYESLGKKAEYVDSRTSSLDSKSDYYDTVSKIIDEPKTKCHHEYDRKIQFERNYGTGASKKSSDGERDSARSFGGSKYDTYPSFKGTSHVHSISLQNVETEQNIRANRQFASFEQNTVPRTQKSSHFPRLPEPEPPKAQTTYIWPEAIVGIPTEIVDMPAKPPSTQRSTESESNIFSFDEDKIQSLQESDMELGLCAEHAAEQEEIAPKRYRDVFMEIDTKRLDLSRTESFPLHQPIERTKSDPNSLARQRIGLISRRHTLMHQQSIDLTPAESSDDDYLYKQIPSAPPIAKYRGSHFEMPVAEFGHFDVLKRGIEGQKTKFEVPKSQFEVLGAKTQSDLSNPPPKNDFDIPYVLHKRHVMNGTATAKPAEVETQETLAEASLLRKVPESPKFPPQVDEPWSKKTKPKSPVEPEASSFLFTQNIDLSKVDPVTLEVDKSEKPVQHLSSPKRDITRIDPVLLETLNSKLSQIESDSPTSSKTESLRPEHKLKIEMKPDILKPKIVDVKLAAPPPEPPEIKPKPVIAKDKIKTDVKPKRIIKPRMQPGKKGGKTHKTKVRITSFSSDDESLDSDDVFGTAEATPTKLEFSPPQTRKEMEGILKYESERKTQLQYTMSSTEVEGSPPQTRKAEHLPIDRSLDPAYQTELRRISERSISIPSSEEDFNPADLNRPVFSEPNEPPLDTVDEQVEDKKEPEVEGTKSEEDKDEEEETVITSPERSLSAKSKDVAAVSPGSKRKVGQSPLLFAHARLNLSEGSAYTMLQKQKAAESPATARRTKSLDAPIISLSRLPALNAFSSKDDTVEEEAPKPVLENLEKVQEEATPETKEPSPKELSPKEKDQIVPCSPKGKRLDKKGKLLFTKPGTVRSGNGAKSTGKTVTLTKTVKEVGKAGTTKAVSKPPVPVRLSSKMASTSKVGVTKDKLTAQKSLPETKEREKVLATQKSLPSQMSLTLPEIKRTKSQEMETCKRPATKEKSKSIEKLELKRTGSRERSKSQDESDDSAKRKEKQQILYEIAVKQTLKSPVKDVLPVFPQVEESVRENRGKLEITIDTIENTSIPLEEAIIITKSPKKLDKNLTKSLELDLTSSKEDKEENGTFQRLGKSLDIEIQDTGESADTEFDFKPEVVGATLKEDEEGQESSAVVETSPESDGQIIQEVHEAQIHHSTKDVDSDDDKTLQDIPHDNVILEGTSLDVWISVDGKTDQQPKEEKVLENVTVLQKSEDNSFFEERATAKPPDLGKADLKSSSESHSLEKMSLGNSLEIKYIDDSGDSSHKSDKDATLIADIQKGAATVSQLVTHNVNAATAADAAADDDTLVNSAHFKITSEDESLTEVSDLRCELDNNLLGGSDHKGALIKLSVERSRSEDTASWVTVECDEYLGVESFEVEEAPLESPEKESTGDSQTHTLMAELEDAAKQVDEVKEKEKEKPEEIKDENLLSTRFRHNKGDLLKRSSDHSRSSDTTGSWTSGEKDLSPGKDQKETGDESSLSCSIGQAIGISQHIEMFETREQLDMTAIELDRKTDDAPRSPRSPRICVLGRTFTIDEDSASNVLPSESGQKLSDESSSDGANDIPKDGAPKSDGEFGGVKYKKKPYPFEQKWSNDSELGQRVHQKISKKLSDTKASLSSLDESVSEKRRNGKGLQSLEKLSTESRNSLDTESSSGSLGAAVRMQKTGQLPVGEPSSTWRPFLIASSDSSSLEEGYLPADRDFDQEYFLSRESSSDFAAMYDVACRKSDVEDNGKESDEYQPDLGDFPTSFGYPCLAGAVGGLGMGPPDLIPAYGTSFLSRTLSRISERSTNSEKSSVDEESTKASTHSDSVDESMASSDHPASLSSDPPSHAHGSDSDKKTPTNGRSSRKKEKLPSEKNSSNNIPNINNLILARQMSDDRRTSAEMADLSMDDIEIITSERGLQLKRQNSDDTIIDEESPELYRKESVNSSQESEEWPLPEIPPRGEAQRLDRESLLALHENVSTDTSQPTTQISKIPPPVNIPKIFGHRASIKSQDSEQWPSPPSSLLETPVVGSFETYSMNPEEACRVTVDSNTVSTYDNDSVADSSEDNKTLEMDKSGGQQSVEPDYDEVKNSDSNSISEASASGSASGSASASATKSGVKIVLEAKSNDSPSSNSEDFNVTLNDDVFTDTVVDTSKNELRPPTVMRRSTASDDSSHSGAKVELKPPSRKGSHSSYSDEDCTSSFGTNLEDGTVRFQLRPTKCTHSSHSEDTSIGLSLSEWSNSTNTVKLQNLSTSNSGTTKSSTNTSGGLKSDDNSLTDIAQSISEWTSSNSNSLKMQQGSNIQFQKISTSTTESTTLTEKIPSSITELSTSTDTSTLVPQQFFSLQQEYPITRLGSSFDENEEEEEEEEEEEDEEFVKVSQSVPTESSIQLHHNIQQEILHELQDIPPPAPPPQFTKSTERPIKIPVQYLTSDTEKSTESSIEQKTVHSVKAASFEKRSIPGKHLPSSKSTERPVKVPLKLSKTAAYYSSSLSSESAPLTSSKPIPISKTATVPLTRTHRKPMTKSMFQTKSPPSENDSTSSMDSPKSTPDSRDRVRGYRRRRQLPPKKHKTEKDRARDDYQQQFYTDDALEQYMRNRKMDEMAACFEFEGAHCSMYVENLEEGYYPDGDSQSGSDIFRIEGEEENVDRYETVTEGFDVSLIPPPLIEDDFEDDRLPEI